MYLWSVTIKLYRWMFGLACIEWWIADLTGNGIGSGSRLSLIFLLYVILVVVFQFGVDSHHHHYPSSPNFAHANLLGLYLDVYRNFNWSIFVISFGWSPKYFTAGTLNSCNSFCDDSTILPNTNNLFLSVNMQYQWRFPLVCQCF